MIFQGEDAPGPKRIRDLNTPFPTEERKIQATRILMHVFKVIMIYDICHLFQITSISLLLLLLQLLLASVSSFFLHGNGNCIKLPLEFIKKESIYK